MWICKQYIEKDEKGAYTNIRFPKGDKRMRIAICADEHVLVGNLRQALDISGVLPEDTEISEHDDGISLLSEHKKYPYDIVLLDIEMSGMIGLKTGHELRSMDKNVIILCVTSIESYAYESSRVEPFYYLMKPIDYSKVSEVLGKAIRKLKERNYVVDFSWKGKHYELKLSNIIYLENDWGNVKFITIDSRYMSADKLDEYDRILSPYGFLRCHRNYLINMSYIKSINTEEINTTFGHTVYMKKKKKQECLNAFNNYITKYKV